MRPRRVARPGRVAAALLAGMWLAGVAPAGPAPRHPIVVDAAYSYVDYKTNSVVFRNIVVSQGNTRVSAEKAHASGVGFTNSEWTFDGHVIFELQPRGTLHADQAVVQFRDDRITRARATGQPALFEQQHEGARGAVHGHADRIVYDALRDTVQLSGDARLSDERNEEISGPQLVYDIRKEQLQAASPGAGRGVHITVNPPGRQK